MMNPLTQASSNRQGIAYVLSRMDWYWNLSRLLLDENITEAHSQGLRGELEKVITDLNSKLLLFQMKSVCYYHRGRLSGFARDLIKLDNWDGELSAIQAAEAAVQTDSAQYNTLSIRNRLGEIAETAKSQNVKLDSISSAIREQTRQQERIHETSADNTCLADLRLTDPRDDRKRIEETKGGLLRTHTGGSSRTQTSNGGAMTRRTRSYGSKPIPARARRCCCAALSTSCSNRWAPQTFFHTSSAKRQTHASTTPTPH